MWVIPEMRGSCFSLWIQQEIDWTQHRELGTHHWAASLCLTSLTHTHTHTHLNIFISDAKTRLEVKEKRFWHEKHKRSGGFLHHLQLWDQRKSQKDGGRSRFYFGTWRNRDDDEEMLQFSGKAFKQICHRRMRSCQARTIHPGSSLLINPLFPRSIPPLLSLFLSSICSSLHSKNKGSSFGKQQHEATIVLEAPAMPWSAVSLGIYFWKALHTHTHSHTRQHVNKYPQSSHHRSAIWLVFAFRHFSQGGNI